MMVYEVGAKGTEELTERFKNKKDTEDYYMGLCYSYDVEVWFSEVEVDDEE